MVEMEKNPKCLMWYESNDKIVGNCLSTVIRSPMLYETKCFVGYDQDQAW